MDQLGKTMSQEKVPVPNLDWLDLQAADKDNIPTPNNVQILPQLQDAWSHTEQRSTQLIPNVISVTPKKASEVPSEDVRDLIRQAKREMMAGVTGKTLSAKLSARYMPDVILAAKDELIKLSAEQGLLGNVYLDMTAFDSCAEAARILGKNRVRTARCVVGSPTRNVCSSHKTGVCRDMGKKVVASMEYTKDMLDDYTTHLRISGKIAATATVDSKESLREAFLSVPAKPVESAPRVEEKVDVNKMVTALAAENQKSAAMQEKTARQQRFYKARPIMAYMQDQMLRGKMGAALKEALLSKFPMEDLKEYAPEIKKIAGLQGLLGNVYVDISYYKNVPEAVEAIKSASTNPLYLIQTVKEKAYDDSLIKVAKDTGCTEFPKDGRIDKSVATSYISDLQFSDRISSEVAEGLRSKITAGANILGVIRDTFLATQSHKRKVREGGVQATLSQGVSKKAADREMLKKNASKALEAGVMLNKLEDKLATIIPTVEAIGMVRSVLASMDTVDASCLPRCASEKYQFKYNACIKKAEKCNGCIFTSPTACTHLGVKFAGAKDLDKAYLDLDPKTAKVQLEENPDLKRADMLQEYDMSDNFGSGMNIALNNIRKRGASDDVDISFSTEGMDMNLSDIK